jgi:hypothetical protein
MPPVLAGLRITGIGAAGRSCALGWLAARNGQQWNSCPEQERAGGADEAPPGDAPGHVARDALDPGIEGVAHVRHSDTT